MLSISQKFRRSVYNFIDDVVARRIALVPLPSISSGSYSTQAIMAMDRKEAVIAARKCKKEQNAPCLICQLPSWKQL